MKPRPVQAPTPPHQLRMQVKLLPMPQRTSPLHPIKPPLQRQMRPLPPLMPPPRPPNHSPPPMPLRTSRPPPMSQWRLLPLPLVSLTKRTRMRVPLLLRIRQKVMRVSQRVQVTPRRTKRQKERRMSPVSAAITTLRQRAMTLRPPQPISLLHPTSPDPHPMKPNRHLMRPTRHLTRVNLPPTRPSRHPTRPTQLRTRPQLLPTPLKNPLRMRPTQPQLPPPKPTRPTRPVEQCPLPLPRMSPMLPLRTRTPLNRLLLHRIRPMPMPQSQSAM